MQEPPATEYVRRAARRTNALVGAAALIALVTVSGAAAASVATAAASDVDVSIALLPGAAKPVANTPFSLHIGMGNAGPDTAGARLVVQLPPGLQATLANRLGCPAGTGTLDCGPHQLAAGESTDDVLRVVAWPGTYAVVVHGIDVTPSDSNAANNTASYTAVVSTAAPPTVKMRVFDLDGDILLARVHPGWPVVIKTWVRWPVLATSVFSLQVCVLTKRVPRCSDPTPARRNFPYSTDATVSPATVVKGRFSAFARLNGRVLQRISVPVKSR
jgi:hypothetical protein